MASNKPQTVWRRTSTEEVALVDNTPESDGLESARELRDTYLAKASWVERFKPGAGKYYRDAAAALTQFIGDYVGIDVTLTLAVNA